MVEGVEFDPLFGGGGPIRLDTLGIGEVFATLLPEQSQFFSLSASGDQASANRLSNYYALYSTGDVMFVPEPTIFVLLLIGLVVLITINRHEIKRKNRFSSPCHGWVG